MKKVLMVSLIFTLVSLMAIPIAYGYPVYQNDLVNLTRGTGSGSGGEFNLSKVNAPSQTNMFSTFCLEVNEYITLGTTYKVGSIDTAAIAGGAGGPSPDPLDARTAYLFYHFTIGDLSGYTYGSNASADSLQQAIWYIEQEGGTNNSFVTLAQTAINDGKWSGLGDVRVLNLVDRYTGEYKQSLLTRVPEPLTMLLVGIGLVGLAGLRRKE